MREFADALAAVFGLVFVGAVVGGAAGLALAEVARALVDWLAG